MPITVREHPPLRLAYKVEAPSGQCFRWAGDERDPANVHRDTHISSTMPGGYESADAVLARDPTQDYKDLTRLSKATIYGAGGMVAWQGRLERAPDTSGDQMSIAPGCSGYQAALDDDKTVQIPYVDRDLSHWAETSRTFRSAALAAGRSLGGFSTPSDSALPALTLAFQGLIQKSLAAAAYDAGAGSKVGAVYYDFLPGANVNSADANWDWDVTVAASDAYTGGSGSGNLRAASGAGYFTPGTPARYALFQLFYALAAAGVSGTTYNVDFRKLAVYANHGLTRRGPDPGGFLASDVIPHALSTWAPELGYTTGPDGSIQASEFIIQHLAFLNATTVSEIVRQAVRFELLDWAVWDGPTFYLNARNARGRKWRARVGPANLQRVGPQIDKLWDSVVVYYRDVDGSTRTVGPPGSGADTEDASLFDAEVAATTAPANRRREALQMGVSTPAGAIKAGSGFLVAQKTLDRAGQATLVGYVEDDRGVLWPAWMVKAGDQIEFVDASDRSARRIVRADYGDGDKAAQVDLDHPPEALQALLERYDLALMGTGVAG